MTRYRAVGWELAANRVSAVDDAFVRQGVAVYLKMGIPQSALDAAGWISTGTSLWPCGARFLQLWQRAQDEAVSEDEIRRTLVAEEPQLSHAPQMVEELLAIMIQLGVWAPWPVPAEQGDSFGLHFAAGFQYPDTDRFEGFWPYWAASEAVLSLRQHSDIAAAFFALAQAGKDATAFVGEVSGFLNDWMRVHQSSTILLPVSAWTPATHSALERAQSMDLPALLYPWLCKDLDTLPRLGLHSRLVSVRRGPFTYQPVPLTERVS